jgi:citrate lyase subunit beta / citryl-CoA lyase
MASRVTIGSDAKGDCRVCAEPAAAIAVEVKTKAAQLLERGLRTVIQKQLDRHGNPSVQILVEDFGALDYVLAARLERALGALLHEPIPAMTSEVPRMPAAKDAPRRSRLYVPGNSPRLLAGIEVHGADCVLLDLEDSVPPAEKGSARALVKHLLAKVPFPREVWVRINPLGLGGTEDAEEVLQGRPHGICLPKTETADDVRAAAELLARVESMLGIEKGFTKIMPIVETARGVLHAEAIAAADERVVMLAFGAEDYTRDLGALRSERSLMLARAQLVVAAKAAGCQASDTVFADLGDEVRLADECRLARELGFDGKGAINPRQIPVIHRAFTPTEEEAAYARRVVDAAAEAEAAGSGAVALDGKMIDRPVLARAQRLIKYRRLLGMRGDGE